MEQQTGSKLGIEWIKTVYCDPVYLSYITEYIMGNAHLDEAQTGIKIARREISVISDMQMTLPLRQEVKSFLMKVQEESEKVGLKLNIKKN